MLKRYTRRTYYASPQSEQAITTIQERYSQSTSSDVIREALIRWAEALNAPVPAKGKGKTG